MMLRTLDLFSGIGGFSLGLERTGGFKTVAFVEIDPFCRKVLAKHWPEVPCYDDVRTLTGERLKADGVSVDVICGGFPCQDISLAGAGAGIDGERSGLWSEYARIIGELRPQFILVENVAALLGRGLDRVLADLAALGYDAEWHCIPAAAVGAPHRRDRIWIVAYTGAVGSEPRVDHVQTRQSESDRCGKDLADTNCDRWPSREGNISSARHRHSPPAGGRNEHVADSIGPRLEGGAIFARHLAHELQTIERGGSLLHAASARSHASAFAGVCRGEKSSRSWHGQSQRSDWWLIEPDVGRVAHGLPARVDRLRSLGNAVVPQIPELIGNAILASLKQAEAA